jgi:hypothetical protein
MASSEIKVSISVRRIWLAVCFVKVVAFFYWLAGTEPSERAVAKVASVATKLTTIKVTH